MASNSTADGAMVPPWNCIGSVASQKWTVTAGRDLVNNASGKRLDVKDNNTANGAKLQLWACTGASNQKRTAP